MRWPQSLQPPIFIHSLRGKTTISRNISNDLGLALQNYTFIYLTNHNMAETTRSESALIFQIEINLIANNNNYGLLHQPLQWQ